MDLAYPELHQHDFNDHQQLARSLRSVQEQRIAPTTRQEDTRAIGRAETIHSTGTFLAGRPAYHGSSRQSAPGCKRQLLKATSPDQFPSCLARASLRDRYELTRFALDSGCSLESLANSAPLPFEEYSSLWEWTKQLPLELISDRSSTPAWNRATHCFQNVVLSGDLSFNEKQGDSLFRLNLKPLKSEMSCRIFRRFGQDRFMTINIPGLVRHNVPAHLRHDLEQLTEEIPQWLVCTEHHLLGRVWRALDIKPLPSRRVARQDDDDTKSINEKGYRVLLFAERGCDISPSNGALPSETETSTSHTEMTVEQLLQWFMPWERNERIPYPKAFARLGLGLSQTQDTIVFEPHEVIRCDDYTPYSRPSGGLDFDRSDLKKTGVEDADCCCEARRHDVVMNDGCGRISREAAFDIASQLGIRDSMPSAFQGRLGGAKGLWMVDTTDQQLGLSGRNYWIEVYDSQLKFEPHAEDHGFCADPARLTFEVVEWSRPLSAAALNFQLIPILVHGETSREEMQAILADLLKEDITTRVAELETAIDRPLALRKWNQDVSLGGKARAQVDGVQMFGGLPGEQTERINWFLEHGFEPNSCRFFGHTLQKVMTTYCERLESRGRISVGRSTFAYIGFDHTGILEEDEIHLTFSSPFKDPQSGFEDNMLHEIDVLVARLPALHPWDIQKRRAVFRPELRGIRDVVVFSSKGSTPLAAALSGGDYDGDKAWVCWDPRIVDSFNPTPPPPDLETQSEQDNHYGITRETTTLGDIIATPTNPTLTFLSLSFSFMLQPSVLGFATTTHERLCYLKQSIAHPSSISLATLCGLLVDRPKQGINFPPSAFHKYLQSLAIPRLPDPAYRNNGRTRRTDHILDHLLFSVAKPLIETSLARLSSNIEHAPLSDLDLTALYKQEQHDATTASDRELTRALQTLLAQISTVHDYWSLHLTPRPHTSTTEPSILHHVTHAQSLFSSILPSPSTTHPLLLRWRLDALRTPATAPPSHWALLRASAAFYRHAASRFVWYIAGRELGLLKAAAARVPTHTVISLLYNGYKLDAGYAKRVENRALGLGERTEPVSGRESQEQQEDNDADEFGEERWFEQEMMAVVEGVEGLRTGEEGEEFGGDEMEGEMLEVAHLLGC